MHFPHQFLRAGTLASIGAVCSAAAVDAQTPAKLWHTVTLTFDGPAGLSETSTPNPFRDHRLDVTWTAPDGRQFVVAGHYAADGVAAESGATDGMTWRSYFVPDQLGIWSWQTSFVTGPDVAILPAGNGTPTAFDGAQGTVDVQPSDKTSPDFRARGRLQMVGRRQMRFAGSGEWFLEIGSSSPENILAYQDFDGTTDRGGVVSGFLHAFEPHRQHFHGLGGGPSWRGSLGEGLLGAVNYLASEGLNSMLVLSFSGYGDGDDVWPWLDRDDPTRFDCSKLDQWQRVLDHACSRGMHVQVLLNETENESFFEVRDGAGTFSDDRKLYYREMISRFGHLLGLTWNIGEEIGWTTGTPFARGTTEAQRRAFAAHIKSLDPYDHPVMVHTYHNNRTGVGQNGILDPLSDPNNPAFDINGAALQGPFDSGQSVNAPSADENANNHAKVVRFVNRSELCGNPWLVATQEQMPPFWGTVPDGHGRDPGHDLTRKDILWGTFVGGGAGVLHYAGYAFRNTTGDDITLEDFSTRADLWRQSRLVVEAFRAWLPFHRMDPNDDLVDDPLAYCLADAGRIYAVYRRSAGTSIGLDLQSSSAEFSVRWFDPRNGGGLQLGTVATVTGPGVVDLGAPPAAAIQDWLAIVERTGRRDGTGCSTATLEFDGAAEPGGALRLRFATVPGGALPLGMLIGGGLPAPFPLPPSVSCVTPCLTDVQPDVWAGGLIDFTLQVPNDPALAGGMIRAQGVLAAPCLAATPSYDVELLAPR